MTFESYIKTKLEQLDDKMLLSMNNSNMDEANCIRPIDEYADRVIKSEETFIGNIYSTLQFLIRPFIFRHDYYKYDKDKVEFTFIYKEDIRKHIDIDKLVSCLIDRNPTYIYLYSLWKEEYMKRSKNNENNI